MPRVAKLLPIPRRFDAKGIQRYGFHGLSYAYLMEELAHLGDPAATKAQFETVHAECEEVATIDYNSRDPSAKVSGTGNTLLPIG
jgi:acetate kinase